jgi:hemoglobin/transferrin/lactoferrin receptor protein
MALNHRRMALLTTALVTLAAGPAFAQQTATKTDVDCTATPNDPSCKPVDKSGSTYLSPLVVSAPTAGGIGDPYSQPKAVNTVSSDEINQFGGQNLDNALRSEAGVFTHDNPQNPGIGVNIRGMDGYGRVTMEIDGARQNFRFTGHDTAGMTFVDPALLAGIDVTRGSSSDAGGAGALAGVVDFRTIGIDDLITDDRNWGGMTSLTAGTNGDGVSEMGAGAFRVSDTFAILGAVSKRNNFDYSNGAGEVVQNTGQDILSGLLKAEITPNADTKVTLSGLVYNDAFTANGYEQTLRNQTYTANFDYAPVDNELVDLHGGINFNDTRMEYTGQEPGNPFVGSPFLPYVGRIIDDSSLGMHVKNTSRGNLGDVGIASTYGLEYNHDHADVTEPGGTPGINPTGTSDLVSIFNSTTVSTGPIDITGGLRGTAYTASGVVPLSSANADPSFSGASSLSVASLDPSLTLAANPTDWFQPYVSYSHTFRPPTVSELYASGAHPGGVPILFGANPNLGAEAANNYEIGANFKRDDLITSGDSLRVKADYFYSTIDNYIAGGYDFNQFPIPWHFVNVPGTSILQGLEVQAAYDAGGYFGSLAYAHTSSDLPSTALSSVTYVPADVLTATLGVRLLDDHSLTLGGRLHAVSETKVGYDDENGVQPPPLPGYQLVDLFANYKLENGIELGAGISNVFNVAYTSSLSTTPDLDPAGGTGRGRTFELTAKARF